MYFFSLNPRFRASGHYG